jgi:hypothetical protein
LVKGLCERGTGVFAQLEAKLRLDEYVAATVRDGADVVHLLAGLTADFLNLCGADAPGGGKRHPGDEV